MSLQQELATVIADGQSSGRLWLYSNYHCNLACRYCLTSSSPSSPVRELLPKQMLEAVQQAKILGFQSVGITGGEPFLLSSMPALLVEIAKILPVIVLSNGTLLGRPKIREQLLHSRGLPLQIQVSVDDPDPTVHDANRGVGSFARAIAGIPWLIEQGISVRISSTRHFETLQEQRVHEQNMQHWMSELGMNSDEHVGRTMVQRGQAVEAGLGVSVETDVLPADLTLTRMGAFYSPFAPTFIGDRLQTDMLLSRTILPLQIPLRQFLNVIGQAQPSDKSADRSGFV